jgi:uncharacterized protein
MSATQKPQSGPTPGTFCWNELLTRDKSRAIDFYTRLLGWTIEPMNMGELGTYTVLKCGERGVGGIVEMKGPDSDGQTPHWTSYVAVENIEAVVEKAVSLGARIIEPINKVPNVGKIAFIEDPTGAKIALYESE